jgi:hypothetical protein
VKAVFTIEVAPVTGRVGVHAVWRHADTTRWTVGIWSSMDEFRAEIGPID